MYSFLATTQKAAPAVEDFDWFVYSKAAPAEVSANLTLVKGTKFGVRPHPISAHSIEIMVDGQSRVHNVSMVRAQSLARGVKRK